MASFLASALLVLGVIMLLASLDDVLVDILTRVRLKDPRIRPLSKRDPNEKKARRPRIAVFVANWHEADVLGTMVEQNLANFTYPKVKFVLGVYPNDEETKAVAMELAKRHPASVEVVVNRRAGPTSKGQMLNEMFAHLYAKPDRAPDLVVLHDSEDVIAPGSFDIYARVSAHHAMIQIPIFSIDSRHRSLVGATYMEEFAERHTREMLLRETLGAFVPSAGVGTCLRKDLILHFIRSRGFVLQPGSVTEDYILGAEAHRDGFSTTFAAFRSGDDKKSPIIATLEYFPKDVWASVKQRTRWTYGIGFEGAKRLGWFGSAWNRFFLYRDRKGVITNFLPLISLVVLLLCLVITPDMSQFADWQRNLLTITLAINSLNIVLRVYQKGMALREVYGSFDPLGLVARWPVALSINALAVGRAWKSFIVESGLASKSITWVKTQHELPENFAAANAEAAAIPVPVTAGSPGLKAAGLRFQRRVTGVVAFTFLAVIVAGGLRLREAYMVPVAERVADAEEAGSSGNAGGEGRYVVEIGGWRVGLSARTEDSQVAPTQLVELSPQENENLRQTAAALAELSLAETEEKERRIQLAARAPTEMELALLIAEEKENEGAAESEVGATIAYVLPEMNEAGVHATAQALAEHSLVTASLDERTVLAWAEEARSLNSIVVAEAAHVSDQAPSRIGADTEVAEDEVDTDEIRLAALENERRDASRAAEAALASARAEESGILSKTGALASGKAAEAGIVSAHAFDGDAQTGVTSTEKREGARPGDGLETHHGATIVAAESPDQKRVVGRPESQTPANHVLPKRDEELVGLTDIEPEGGAALPKSGMMDDAREGGTSTGKKPASKGTKLSKVADGLAPAGKKQMAGPGAKAKPLSVVSTEKATSRGAKAMALSKKKSKAASVLIASRKFLKKKSFGPVVVLPVSVADMPGPTMKRGGTFLRKRCRGSECSNKPG